MLTLTLLLAVTPADLGATMHARIDARESPARRSCRRSPGGCRARLEAIAAAFIASGKAYGLDPYLLAAIAWDESRWSVDARGSRNEIGVMQVHPGAWKAARLTRLYREPEKCAKQTDGCQPEIIAVAAEILRDAIAMCGGSVWRGVAVYHTGNRQHCKATEPGPYVRRVLAMVASMKGEA